MLDTSTHESRALFYNSKPWRKLREDALDRDNYECVWCKAAGRVTGQQSTVLEVDHIKELEFYPEFALDLGNLRTLCKDCHNKRHHRFNYASHGPKKENKWKDDERWD